MNYLEGNIYTDGQIILFRFYAYVVDVTMKSFSLGINRVQMNYLHFYKMKFAKSIVMFVLKFLLMPKYPL